MYVTVISMCGVADKHRMFNLVWVKVILKLHANCCCGESLIILLFAVSGLQREIEVSLHKYMYWLHMHNVQMYVVHVQSCMCMSICVLHSLANYQGTKYKEIDSMAS